MKKLYRSTKDKMLGGICGGISEYFDVDPSLIRLISVLLLLLNGAAFIVYILAWIIIPKEPIFPLVYDEPKTAPAEKEEETV